MYKRLQKAGSSVLYALAFVVMGASIALLFSMGQERLVEGGEGSSTGDHKRARGAALPPDSTSSPWTPVTQKAADSSGPRVVGRWAGITSAVAADRQIVYRGDWWEMEVVSLSDSETTIMEKGQVPFLNNSIIEGIALSDGYAYVAEDGFTSNGAPVEYYMLRVVDIHSSAHPRTIGSLDVEGDPWSIAVSGSHAYVAGDHGLRVFNVSDPARPRAVEVFNNEIRDVAVQDERAYLTDDTGLQVLDVSSPTTPRKIGNLSLDGTAANLAVAGEYAYVAVNNQEGDRNAGGTSHGLRIVDLSVPTAPRSVAAFDTPGPVSEVALERGQAYITHAACSSGNPECLQVIDVTSPAKPQSSDVLPLDDAHGSDAAGKIDIVDLDVAGGYLYLAGMHAGMVVVKLPGE